MSTVREFCLPDVGEGLTEAEVATWHVAIGDRVAVNEVVVDIETAKSVVELPTPYAGIVTALHVPEGATVPVGTPLLSVDAADPTPPTSPRSGHVPSPREAPATSDAGPSAVLDDVIRSRPAVLVGTGPKDAAPRRRRLGARAASSTAAARETRTPVRGVRRATAEAVSHSAFTAPHVTEWLTVDVTRTMHLVQELRSDRAWAGVRVTPLLLVARAFLLAIRNFPDINATWDEQAQEIVVKHYVNLGIAATTRRGLLVPNVKDAHAMDLRQLADALEELVTTTRAGRTGPTDMTGGTVTITNIGSFGVDSGTPILNSGESAILAFGAVRPSPWVVDDAVTVRQVTQLALSFDHRLVDGELGSRVLARTGELLHDPGATFLYC